MGHLNGILARVGGNLSDNFQKSQMPGGLPGGGMLRLRFDPYIMLIVQLCCNDNESVQLTFLDIFGNTCNKITDYHLLLALSGFGACRGSGQCGGLFLSKKRK